MVLLSAPASRNSEPSHVISVFVVITPLELTSNSDAITCIVPANNEPDNVNSSADTRKVPDDVSDDFSVESLSMLSVATSTNADVVHVTVVELIIINESETDSVSWADQLVPVRLPLTKAMADSAVTVELVTTNEDTCAHISRGQ